MEDTLKNISEAQTRIDEKKSKLFFYLPSMPQASGGIGVVYQHVKVLTDLGYDATVVYDGAEYKKPTWLGEVYTSLKHARLDDPKKPITVSMDDILIIPEGFTNIMERTNGKLPCKRIVLCQSYQYVLDSLMPGIGWDYFGIRDVIVVTPTLQQYLESVFGNRFKIKVCRPSVDDKIFKPSALPKQPIIAISSRDPQTVLNLTKHFYMAYPQYKWVSFKHMSDLSREGFAAQLGKACLAVWVDQIAGFGTFPVECAKSKTPFIALIPNIIPEYAGDDKGIWTNSLLDIPNMIAGYFKLWFEDNEPPVILDGLAKLAEMYKPEDEINNIAQIYGDYLSERKNELQEIYNKIKTEEIV